MRNDDASQCRKQRWRWASYGAAGALAATAVAAVAVCTCFERDMRAARTRLAHVPTEVFHGPLGDIEYRVTGSGPTVLISHGVTGGFDQGIALTDRFGFFGTGYRFLYISRFGYLNSSFPPNASARLQAAAYKTLLDHLGIGPLFIFGNSAGGTSAMWFAIDFPERTAGLILHSSAIPGPLLDAPPRVLMKHDFLYWAAAKAIPDTLIGAVLPDEVRSTLTREEKSFVIENVFLASLPVSKRTRGIIFDNEISTPSVNQIPLEEIKTPTLILQALDDPRERSGGLELARRIPNGRFVGLTGGHLLIRSQPKAEKEIARFVLKRR